MVKPQWVNNLKVYSEKNNFRASMQLVNSILPYLAIMFTMYIVISQGLSYFFLVPLAILAAGFYIRIFIIFHDCVHLSFMSSERGCRIIGNVLGVLTFTSYEEWRKSHMIHHGTVGNIDKKGVGDVWTMTVQEYKNSTAKKKFLYRLFRNPIFLFVISPVVLFVVINRMPKSDRKRNEVLSVLITNTAIIAIILFVSYTVGLKYYALIQLPIVFIATSVGVWLFFVQHQFEDVYWARKNEWDIYRAAIEGSSYYRLPAILRWFTGNIGFHHIHHLNPSIPNYNLKKCQEETPELQGKKPMRLFKSLKSLRLKLYDEERKRMISFSDLRHT